jgi:hypothetical protein
MFRSVLPVNMILNRPPRSSLESGGLGMLRQVKRDGQGIGGAETFAKVGEVEDGKFHHKATTDLAAAMQPDIAWNYEPEV